MNIRGFISLLKHEVNKRGFISESIQRWLVIKLVILIHSYSYLISFEIEIIVGNSKLRSFQGPQVKISVLQEQPNITYPSHNS